MQIRQLAVHYLPEADRLLLRVNASDGQQFSLWLTRRLCLRLWPHLDGMITQLGIAQEVAQVSPGATVMPEAAGMLAEAARDRALRNTDFASPFEPEAKAQPLGPEPMLAVAIELTPVTPGHLRLVIADAAKRKVQLQLTEQLATAVRELMGKALRQSEWGVIPDATPAPETAPETRVLN